MTDKEEELLKDIAYVKTEIKKILNMCQVMSPAQKDKLKHLNKYLQDILDINN
jgi:hypothetical protein